MDSLIAAAARALAQGDALAALKHVSLRDDPGALALRGIAMAQLGELARARELLRRAARGFGAHEAVARARCLVAEAEVALAQRDLGGSPRALAAAGALLAAHGDRANALQARLLSLRRLLLLGRLHEAADQLDALDTAPPLPPALVAIAELARAELALRGLRVDAARDALAHAQTLAQRACVPALQAEVAHAAGLLARPAARRMAPGGGEPLRLAQVAALVEAGTLVVDACRRGVRRGADWRPLARRPVLFALAHALAQAWPGDCTREALIAQAFRQRAPDDTLRARLRVEMGRLRAQVAGLAAIEATPRGFRLVAHEGRTVALLAPPIDGEAASLLALLADGAAWSTSALALALDESQRSVQRALAELEAKGRVRGIGQARARRWLAPPVADFTTILLLPTALPLG